MSIKSWLRFKHNNFTVKILNYKLHEMLLLSAEEGYAGAPTHHTVPHISVGGTLRAAEYAVMQCMDCHVGKMITKNRARTTALNVAPR